MKQLKTFEKTSLKPGETKTVSLHVGRDDLQTWDEAGHRWTQPDGPMRAYVGASAADIRGTVDL